MKRVRMPGRPKAPNAATEDWPIGDLSAQDVAIIEAGKWHCFGTSTVVAIARAWQAGMTTAQMAADLGCGPGTLRLLLGRLKQIGVDLRSADRMRPASLGRSRSPLAQKLADEQMARLRKLAPHDAIAARTLALFGGS